MFKSARSRLRAAVFACAAALGLGAYAAPTATAVWRSNLGQSYTIGGNTFGVTIPGNETKQAGVLNADGTITVANEWTGFSSPYIGLSSANPTAVSMLVKFSGLSIPESDATGVCLAAMRDSSGNEVGAVVKASSTSLKAYYMENNANTTTEGDVTGGENVVTQSGYMLFSYSTAGGVKIYVGSDIASLAGGAMGSYKYGSNTIERFSIGGDPAGKVYTPSGMKIEEVALFVGSALTNTDVADYAFPTLDGETTALTMTELNTKIAADSNVIFTASPVVTLDVEPSAATKTYLQSAAWNGTVLIKDADKNNIVPTAYGNPNSTLKLSGVKGYFAKAKYGSSSTPAIELEDSETEGRVYGFWNYDGYSFNSYSGYPYVHTPELKGSGSLVADKSGALKTLIVVDKWSAFTGKLQLAPSGIVCFGTGLPEQTEASSAALTAGSIRLSGTVPASIGTWTVGTAFTGSVLTLTTAANATTTAFLTDSTKWKGTCQLNWNHTSALDIVNYGNANSVVEIVSTFSAYPTKNGGNAAANLAAELKLSANWTVANGWDSQTTTFAKLSGTGNLIVNGASSGTTALPYTITKIENFTGALGGARGQFTIGTIVASEEPVGGTKLVSLSNCTKTPVLTNTTVEYNGAAVEGITLEVKSDGIYVAEATVDVTVPVVANTVVTVTVGGETVSPTVEGGNVYAVAPGSVVTVTYAAADGYEISGTTVYTVDTANATTFEVAADMVTAQYVAQIKTGPTTYENFTTLAAALDSENIAYGITLLADVTENNVTVDSAAIITGSHTINANVTIANGGQLQLMLATLNGTLTIQDGGTYVTLGGTLGNVVVQDGGIINLTTLSEDAAPLTVSTLTVNGALTIVSSYGLAERGKTYKAISYITGNATIAEGASFNGSGEWSASTTVDGDNTVVCLEITKVAVVDGVYYDTAQEAVEAAVASGKQAQFLVQPGTVTLGAGETLVVKGGYQPTVELDAGLSTPPYEVESGYDITTGIYTYAVKSYVAQIGDDKYESIAAAVAAATSGQTVTMLADDRVSFTEDNLELSIGKALTIDGAGHTIYGVNDYTGGKGDHDIYISGSGDVTIKNVTLAEFGGAVANNMRTYPIWTGSAYTGTLTLDNVTVRNFNRTAFNLNGGTVVVKDCTITGDTSKDTYFQSGIEAYNANVTVQGTTTITGTGSNLVDWPEAACLQLGNPNGSVAGTGSITITGGTFTGDYGVIVASNASEVVSVTGGTFNGVLEVEDGEGGSLAISGGTFDAVVPEKYLAEGYEVLDNGDGTYGVREDKGWLYAAPGYWNYTGTWTEGAALGDDKVTISDGATYSNRTASAGQLVTVAMTLSFDDVNDDADDFGDAKAAVRLAAGETDGTYQFQLYTSDGENKMWTNATVGVTATKEVDYNFVFVLDLTNKTYTASIVSGTTTNAMTVGGAANILFACQTNVAPVQKIEFIGSGTVSSIEGSYEDAPVPEGFVENDEVTLSDGKATLTAAQATWLNQFGVKLTVAARLAELSSAQFTAAYLLNLDIMGTFSYTFNVTGFGFETVNETECAVVTVTLTRTGALTENEKAKPIVGTLKLKGTATLGTEFTVIDEATVADDDFSEGNTTTITLDKGDAKFFQPVIE